MAGSQNAPLTCDVAVNGAGTAGLAAERAARHAGARTLLIDPYFSGTTCATVGCMPSKLLLAAAHAAHDARSTDVFGVRVAGVRIDGRAVMHRLRRERDRFAGGTRDSFGKLPEGTMIRARARFVDSTTLELDDGRRISARAIVIATGSAPLVPGPLGDLGDAVLTTDTIFEIEDLPRRLAVIGAGAIGVEMAQGMGRLGVEVALFDAGTTPAKIRAPRVAEALKTALARDMTLHLGTKPRPERDGDGVRLSWDEDGRRHSRSFDRVLVATGRPPAVGNLALDATGLTLDDHGVPEFDPATMQCGDAPVFIAGDANADVPLLHEASIEGAIAGTNAARWPQVTPQDRPMGFSIVFSDPAVASIGAAPDQGLICGISDYADQGRARVQDRAEGLVQIHADADGRLIGADLCAPGGEHLAHLLAWAVMSGATATQLLEMPFYHPTLEEGLKQALRQICKGTGTPQPEGRDFGNPPGI